MTNKIALIGAGAMGGAIGARLAETGTDLIVYDRDPEKIAALVAKGAVAASSAADAARQAKAVILSLNSAAIVRAAVYGPQGVAEGAKPGTLIIDMSSIDPETTKALATEGLAHGLRWVDSPLSGGIPKAAIGQLTLMQGGAEADVRETQAILSKLAGNQTHMGGPGAGQTTKMINQVLCGLGFLAVAEATALAEAAGVDVEKIPQALKGGRADSALIYEAARLLAPRRTEKNWRIYGAQDLARLTHTSMPLTAICAEVHRMLTAAGLGGEDQAALMEYFKRPNKELAP
ncbi:hypothetical protein A4X03_0g9816 [Tilletia caries]|uniref:6-phosphogluconate dehydrogenase NADP-binding domain-containing protein n=1 Tax=Tilletia caries TaxID=13290 RepID=A0A8T8S9A9_9BASI|nr:hypothetical protein A4X03_0g9816 [Tilletia caries]